MSLSKPLVIAAVVLLAAFSTCIHSTAVFAEADANIKNESATQDDAIVEIKRKPQTSEKWKNVFPSDAPYALVSIRFPSEYGGNFVRNMIRLRAFRRDTLSTCRAFVNEQVLKSAYYATEFYSYLSSRLPEDSVVLEPCKLAFSADGDVVCNPIRKCVPSVITVDLFANISVDRVRDTTNSRSHKKISNGDTFANHFSIVPNFTVATKNGPVPFAGVPVIGRAGNAVAGMNAERFYNSVCNNEEPKAADRIGDMFVTDNQDETGDRYISVRTDFISPEQLIAEPERLVDGDGRVPCLRTWKLFTHIIESRLLSKNLADIQPFLIAPFIEDFDPALAELLNNGTSVQQTSGTVRHKLELLSRYMENERRKIFALVAQRTEESLYSSELGDSIRTMAKSELEFLKRRQSSKRREYAAAALGLAAGAGSLAAAVSMPTPALSNILTTVSFASVAMLQNENLLQQKLAETYQQFERQSNDAQTTFMLKFGNDALEVSGKNVDALRAQFKEKYQSQFEAYSSRGANL